jgi:hypothetical protein
MSIRTQEDLEDHLNECLAWRRIELSALRTEIGKHRTVNSSGTPISRALVRGGVALLYAHWEGYARDSFGAYLEFLTKRRIRLSELNDGLLRATLVSLHRKMETGDPDAFVILAEAVRLPGSARARIPKSGIVNTRSNLRHDALCEILSSLGLDKSEFISRSHLIDKSLCDARNEIAHGRDSFPSPQSFLSLHANVLQMMETIREQILEAVRAKTYYAQSPS